MLTLASDLLEISVLDPAPERQLLGPRYCGGCYIRQVTTRSGLALLAGPEYPSRPSVINGQGAPEVFQHTLYDDPEAIPEARLIIGVGLVENSAGMRNRDSHWNSHVVEPCLWSVQEHPDSIVMETSQHYKSWQLELRRELSLEGNRLHSKTCLRNAGRSGLPFRWFAHPFFPFHSSLRLHIENLRGRVPRNPAFTVSEEGTISLAESYRWSDGYFLDLPDHAGMKFAARVERDDGAGVEIHGSFALLKLAVWANDRTCSPEPFFSGELAPGHTEEWTLTYTFHNA